LFVRSQFQDVAWGGFKNLKDPTYTSDKPMIGHVKDAIERTHRLTSMPRDEIVKQAFIYSKIPPPSAVLGIELRTVT